MKVLCLCNLISMTIIIKNLNSSHSEIFILISIKKVEETWKGLLFIFSVLRYI